ncbi:MAG: ribosomal protection-like ABC-F family protein [Butyricicoccus sp.]
MSMIKATDLTFSYPGSYDTIFKHCSFQIDTDWKLGLIGRNGRGKTTLLRLLLHEYEYSGTIVSGVPFEYFPYPVCDKSCMTIEVLNEICPDAQDWEFLRECSYLDVEAEVLWQPFETLSNGEQTKVLLAAFFLKEGHFPLIDEPTNHLDAKARQVVSDYLKRKNGYILVSHDRCFLDGCVDHILSINRTTVDVQSGNFSTWMTNFERQQLFEQMQNRKLQKDIRQLQQAAQRTTVWSDRIEQTKHGNGPVDRGYIGHKASKMMKRAKVLETRKMQAVEKKAALLQNTESADKLRMHALPHHSKRIASVSQVSITYEDSAICEPISFEVKQGDRIVLDGKNGSGKSSLLKLLIGEPIHHSGTVSLASGLQISYVPQDTSWLSGTPTEFAREHSLEEPLFRAILRKMGFERIQFEKRMEDYSAGQKKKIFLAKSLCEKAHLYVWDEPLNYIDIYSRMQIEQLVQEAAPTMIFVEHDRKFQELIATRRICL